jgi:hypothetical protein
MPTPDSDPTNWSDWFSQIGQNLSNPYYAMFGRGAAPGPTPQSLQANPGAGIPYARAPVYGAGPGGVMPGGGVMNYPAATPGAPSMGNPALGQSLQANPGAPPGIGMDPSIIARLAAARGAGGGPLGGMPNSAMLGDTGGYMPSLPGFPQANAAPAPASPQGMPFPQAPGPAASNMPYPGQADPRGYWGPTGTPAGTSTATPRPRQGPAGAPAGGPAAPIPPTARAQAPVPNLGYYRPRFGAVQYQVPGGGRGPLSNAPIYSALNLFGGS